MKKFTIHISLLLVLFYGTTCMKGSFLEVSETSFREEVSTKENISFTFNRVLVEAARLNNWDTTQYLNFKPAVPGKFKWTSPNELIFSPAQGFQPSTDYEVTLSQNLTQGKEDITFKSSDAIRFHTTYLQLESSEMFWMQDDRRSSLLKVHLMFNYLVNPNGFRELVQAKVGGEALGSVQVLTQEPSKTITLSLEEVPGKDFSGKLLELTIAPGIKCAESSYSTKEALNIRRDTPDKKRLRIQGIYPEYDKQKSLLRVRTSQSIDITQVINHLRIEPKLVYEVKYMEGGFIIQGNFVTKSTYSISIDKDIQGVFGARLASDYSEDVVFGARPAMIEFTEGNGLYLSSRGQKNIGIRIYSIPKVQVTVHKIYENNLTHFLNLRNNYPYIVRNRLDHFGDIISDREYDTKTLPLVNDFRVLNLDFADSKQTKGIYMVDVRSTENMWDNHRKLVSISDIGFMVKETEEDILVFTNSIISAEALSGVRVSLMSKSNQVLSQLETNSEGVAVFSGIKKKFPDGDIRLITATKNNDFNYIYFNQSRVDLSSFETGGHALPESGYQAFLYGERDLYRPGETIHLNVLLRDRLWKPVGKIPVNIKLKMPNGKDFSAQRVVLNDQGAKDVSFKLPPSTITGTYYAEVFTSTNVFLTSMPISVEEFMPDRIRVRMQLLERDRQNRFTGTLKPGDSTRIQLVAQNLFGPPAANRKYDMRFSLRRTQFSPKKFKDYSFDVSSEVDNPYISTFLLSKNAEGVTDSKGTVYKSFYLPKEYTNLGVLQGNAYATVFDETGRSVSRVMTFDVFTQETFLGIRDFDNYVSTNRTLEVPVIALNKDENVSTSKATLQIIRYKWQTVLEKDYYGNLEYVSRKKEEILREEEITIQGANTKISFAPSLSGSYELRLKQTGAKTYVSRSFYAYGYQYTSNSSFQVNKDGKVTIKLDKKKYKPGEQAKVLFTTPFNGRLLVTVEREKVHQYFYLNTENKSASASLDILPEYLPNVYITATLIRPMSDGALPLTVAHGFEPLMVEDPQSNYTLTIDAPEKVESKTTQTVTVKTNRAESDIEVTLAIVDEGILQLKNYKTPDPHAYFFRKRRLQVSAYDLYPQLFPEISIGSKALGGGGIEADGRANAMVNKRVKLVRFWSGILKTNAAGEAKYTFKIPQFSGSLRVMALAYKNGTFGTAQKNIRVADPIVISTGLPRFLSPGDVIKVPVTLFNTTNQNTPAQVRLETTANLQVTGDERQTTEIKSKGEKQLDFEITAAQVMDSAKVTVQVEAMGRVFREVLDINIRPVVGLVKNAGSGIVEGGKNQSFVLRHDMVPSTIKSKLLVSKSPMIQFADDLGYLIDYPHGCTEQVISGVFPQLYAQELMKSITPQKQNTALYAAEIRENIQEGIMRVQARQTYGGGLSYWPGGSVNAFATTYGTHFLLEARNAGYYIHQAALDQMLNYLQREVTNRELIEYYYLDGENGKRRKKRIVPKESIYALYILALAKKPDIPKMNYFKENPKVLALDSKYLLATAFLISGDKASYQALLPERFSGEVSENVLSGSFHSYLRDEALALNALIEADPGNPQVATMAQHLSELLKNTTSLNTQERAMSLLALGKLSKQLSDTRVRANIRIAQQNLLKLEDQDVNVFENLAGNTVNIQAEGNGSVYYFWDLQGMSASGKVKEEDKGLKVRKTFYDPNGNVITNNTFRQNDLIVVKVSLIAEPFFNTLDNIVITDMLPAGLEIENPRLTSSQGFSFVRNQSYPDYVDIRDDRINYFTKATGTTRDFYYLARAVTRGTFKMGPVSADAMYSGNYYSYANSGTVRILGPDDSGAN